MTTMLSRIAESLFWIGRYVERADDTARILDAYVHRILEDPWADEEASCRSLLRILGVAEPEVVVGSATVLELLAFDPTTPSAIAGAWHAARENARGPARSSPPSCGRHSTRPGSRFPSSASPRSGSGRTRCSRSSASGPPWSTGLPSRR